MYRRTLLAGAATLLLPTASFATPDPNALYWIGGGQDPYDGDDGFDYERMDFRDYQVPKHQLVKLDLAIDRHVAAGLTAPWAADLFKEQIRRQGTASDLEIEDGLEIEGMLFGGVKTAEVKVRNVTAAPRAWGRSAQRKAATWLAADRKGSKEALIRPAVCKNPGKLPLLRGVRKPCVPLPSNFEGYKTA